MSSYFSLVGYLHYKTLLLAVRTFRAKGLLFLQRRYFDQSFEEKKRVFRSVHSADNQKSSHLRLRTEKVKKAPRRNFKNLV